MQIRDEHARRVLRVVVAEDERPAREWLVSALRAHRDIEIVAEAHDGLSLRELLAGNAIDVLFMDEGLPSRESVTDRLGPSGPVLVLMSTDAAPLKPVAPGTREPAASSLVLPKPFTNLELDAVLRGARASAAATAAARSPLPSAGTSAAPSSPMWPTSPTRSNTDSEPAGGANLGAFLLRRARLGRGILGFALLWTVLYLLVLAPPGATGRDAVLTGRALNEALQSHVRLSFSSLSGFEYHPGMSKTELPADVRRAEGREVAITGFMLPIDVNGDGVSEFLLNASYDMCMFGMTAGAPHQWVHVQMADGRRAPFTHVPIAVFGTLDIGEQRQNGRVMSMYRLRAEKVAVYDR
jgi:CheY-like chemotaxis protein